MTNINYRQLWKNIEGSKKQPLRCRDIKVIDYHEFKENVLSSNEDFMHEIVDSLYSGDFYILKSAYSEKFIKDLQKNTFQYFKDKPSEFHKMLEGSPDFHRKIDLETGKKYSINGCKHSFYFYAWNDDPLKIWEPIYQRWRIIKKVMGLEEKEYENNTPKDGVIDRIQVVQYPSKIGYLEPHSDPYKYQRLIHSVYMSKQGIDFEGMGFYVLGENDKIKETEHLIDIGDIGIGYATVYHGVAPVNLSKDPDWEDVNDGRWFLSLYSNESDEVKSRHTSQSVTEKIDINEKFKDKIFPNR